MRLTLTDADLELLTKRSSSFRPFSGRGIPGNAVLGSAHAEKTTLTRGVTFCQSREWHVIILLGVLSQARWPGACTVAHTESSIRASLEHS